jgi:hypothetical protein
MKTPADFPDEESWTNYLIERAEQVEQVNETNSTQV